MTHSHWKVGANKSIKLMKSYCTFVCNGWLWPKKIGMLKKAHGSEPLDQKRWQIVLQSKLALARSLGLSEKLVKEIYEQIHQAALEIEGNL